MRKINQMIMFKLSLKIKLILNMLTLKIKWFRKTEIFFWGTPYVNCDSIFVARRSDVLPGRTTLLPKPQNRFHGPCVNV